MTSLAGTEKTAGAVVLPAVIDIIRPYAKSDRIDAETRLDKIGIDSFDFVEIVFKLEETFGIEIDYNANSTFEQLATVGHLAQDVAARVEAKTAA